MSAVATINELKEKRAGLFEQMREITLAAESEERDLTAEEAQEFDRLEAEADGLEKRFSRLEKISGVEPRGEREVRESPDGDEGGDEEKPPVSLKEFNEQRAAKNRPQDDPEYRSAFFKMLTVPGGPEWTSFMEPDEVRALSKATAAAGANLVPTEFQRTLLDALREYGVMRQLARVFSTSGGETLQIPTVTSHGTASWTAENAAFTESDDAFGQASLSAYKAATIIKISEELLQDAAFDLEDYIRGEFGQRIGILENTAYLVGDGSGKPTGVATQASAGITAASNAAITADELIDLYHSLLSPYRARASWIFKDSTIKVIRKLKDTTNQYLWQPGLTAGAPDTLLSRPVYTDPDMAAVGTVAISVLFGDFSYYWIRDVDGIAFQRLNELYAANGQVGFRAYHRTDGKLLNTAAVKKLTHPV